MKLRYSPSSPFVRKVVVAAMEMGLDARIERIPTNPMKREDRQSSPNPLGKVPCLETDDGLVLYDSPVIIEYLDSLHAGQKLIPVSGNARWVALRRQAMGDGIIENIVLAFIETLRKPERRSEPWIAHNKGAAMRAVDTLEREADTLPGPVDIGRLTLAVALEFVDQHEPDADWRSTRPRLAAWFDSFRLRPSLQSTALLPWA